MNLGFGSVQETACHALCGSFILNLSNTSRSLLLKSIEDLEYAPSL